MTAMTLARLGVKPIVIDSANEDSHTYGRSDAFHPRHVLLFHRCVLIADLRIHRCIEVMKVSIFFPLHRKDNSNLTAQ